jgi:hypothetical protein
MSTQTLKTAIKEPSHARTVTPPQGHDHIDHYANRAKTPSPAASPNMQVFLTSSYLDPTPLADAKVGEGLFGDGAPGRPRCVPVAGSGACDDPEPGTVYVIVTPLETTT